jgi:sugar phosphate isomerase/epimerase
MQLGIIKTWKEQDFIWCKEKGLDFIECDVNGPATNVDEYMTHIDELKGYIETYGVGIGAIGRWGPDRIDENGDLVEVELQASYKLIDACAALGAPVFMCGCNYIKGLSFPANCRAAIKYFSTLVDYATPKGVKVAVYNCDWNNFVYNPRAWDVILPEVPGLGIKYDASHSRYRGDDYMLEIKQYANRFYHMHLKGTLIVGGKRTDDPPAGLDQINWPALMALLYAKRYNGGLAIEPHSQVWQDGLGAWGVDYTINYFKPLLYPGDHVAEWAERKRKREEAERLKALEENK